MRKGGITWGSRDEVSMGYHIYVESILGVELRGELISMWRTGILGGIEVCEWMCIYSTKCGMQGDVEKGCVDIRE